MEGKKMERPEFHKSGNKMDYSELDSLFDEFYESGERVEIEWIDGFEDYTGYGCRTEGRKARGYIGKSTGWKPVYLLIQRTNSYGGPAIRASWVKNIKGLGITKEEMMQINFILRGRRPPKRRRKVA
jgi:hypothetical protein